MTKEKTLNIIKEVFAKDSRIVFAYVYASFATDENFRDIDIGIYVNNSDANPFAVSAEINTELSFLSKREGLHYTANDFDVRVINGAPFTFLKIVFKEGILLIDNDPDLRTDIMNMYQKNTENVRDYLLKHLYYEN